MATLPAQLWKRAIEMFLLAGRYHKDGQLPDTNELAWALRCNMEDLDLDLRQLALTGIIKKTDTGWLVVKFAERQAKMTPAEKMRYYREKLQKQQYYQDENIDVTDELLKVTQITDNRLTESDTDKNHNRGDDGEKSRIHILYENSFGFPPAIMEKELAQIEKTYPPDWIEQAFEASNKAGARGFNYVRKVLENRKNGKNKETRDKRDTPEARRRYAEWEND